MLGLLLADGAPTGGVILFDGSSGFCLGGFSVMLVPKLLLSPVKKLGIFAKNDQILPEIDIFGHIGPGLEGSFGALLVGW